MARPRKDEFINLKDSHDLTDGLIERLTCPPDKDQAFLRDAKAPGLRIRVTAAGHKSFVFEGKVNRKTVRRTIGDAKAWTIESARAEANKLRVTLDQGQDPRELERQAKAAKDEARAREEQAKAAALLELEPARTAWEAYLEASASEWGARNLKDHQTLSQIGGEPRKNRKGALTVAGPLAELLALPLKELTPERLQAWAKGHAESRPARLRLSLRLLKAFLRWCGRQTQFKHLTDTQAIGQDVRRVAGKPDRKNDTLRREQLPAWFAAVRQIQNPVISAYLQCLLIIGCRREELGQLRWDDINNQWKGLNIRDKIEGRREVPLTPFVESLLMALPRRSEWVFSSPVSASGRLVEPSIQHRRACAVAGIDGLTLHGLRRSFANLTEWLDIPGSITAEIQGHAPQGARETNYKRRGLDLLALHHCKIEAAFLEWAGIDFTPQAEPGKLRAVA